MKQLLKYLRISVIATLLLTVVVSFVYPVVVWGVSQAFFNEKANGSLLSIGGKVVGSTLIGQNFSSAQYFHGRPSAAGKGYDAAGSSGSNFGPINEKLLAGVKDRVESYRQINGLDPAVKVPPDAVTASASGLDPHISPRNAALQTPRIAKARNLSEDAVKNLVVRFTEGPDLGLLGDPAVNVLKLNLALDAASSK